jgi:hypothetical protein
MVDKHYVITTFITSDVVGRGQYYTDTVTLTVVKVAMDTNATNKGIHALKESLGMDEKNRNKLGPCTIDISVKR